MGFHGVIKIIEKDVNDEMDTVEVAKVMQTWKVVDSEWMEDQLYQMMVLKVSGNQLNMVKNLQGFAGTRGVMSWQRVHLNARGQNAVRTHDLSRRVVNLGRVRSINDLHTAFEDWVQKRIELEKVTKEPTPDAIRVAGLRNLLPQEMDDDLTKFGSDFTQGYEKLKKHVIAQCRERREPTYAEDTGKTVFAVEGDECKTWELESTDLNLISGNCNWCGGRGHKASQCPTKDAEWTKGKGKDGTKGSSDGPKGGHLIITITVTMLTLRTTLVIGMRVGLTKDLEKVAAQEHMEEVLGGARVGTDTDAED